MKNGCQFVKLQLLIWKGMLDKPIFDATILDTIIL